MRNELLILLSLVVLYGSVLLWMKLFGKQGLYGWTVIATIAANIEVLILVDAFGMEQTLGNVLFASTFLVTDILSESYGKKAAQRAVNIGILTSFSFIVISQSWMLYVPSPNDFISPSIEAVFQNTPRMMLVSLVVYAITQRFGARLPEIRAVVCQQRDRPQHLSAHLLIQAQYEVLCRFCAVGLIIKNHFIFLHIQPAFQLWDLSYIYCMG